MDPLNAYFSGQDGSLRKQATVYERLGFGLHQLGLYCAGRLWVGLAERQPRQSNIHETNLSWPVLKQPVNILETVEISLMGAPI